MNINGSVRFVLRRLSPEVVKLNNATLGKPTGPVFCQDYTYIAKFHDFAWKHPKLILNRSEASCQYCETNSCPTVENAYHKIINNPCFGIFSESTFGDTLLVDTYHSDVLGTELLKPNAYAMWCNTKWRGYMPVMLNRTADLLGIGTANLTSDGAVSVGSCSGSGYTVNGSSACPGFPAFDNRARSFLNGSIAAVHMLQGVANPWLGNVSTISAYLDPTDSGVQSIVCPYALQMGWDGQGALSCPTSHLDLGVNYANCTRNSDNCSSWPLFPAHYYAALKYQCSSLVKGTLCDFGVQPPYAVDEDGNYLTRTQASSRGSIIVSLVPNPTTAQIRPVIITMLVVALAANVLTFANLGCFQWDRMQRCWGRCVVYLFARSSEVKQAAYKALNHCRAHAA